MMATAQDFKHPKPPVNNKKDAPKHSKLKPIPETKTDASVGDAMALDKEGYVNKNMFGASQTSLSHMSYMCPGMHGKDSRQDIRRETFYDLLTHIEVFIIPIFQRRYCWKYEQVEQWYNDSRRGSRDPMGSHNTGNLVITTLSPDQPNHFILIDGQQRVTTTLILISALRDYITTHMLNLSPEHQKLKENFLAKCNKIILAGDGTCKLQPCYLDRPSFYSIVKNQQDIEEDSFQSRAYRIFLTCIDKDVSVIKSPEHKINLISEIYRQCLKLMSVTMVKIENSIDASQVFLWLQEKSFFNGYQLQNLRPGEFFTCSDLVRNLVLAPLLKLPNNEQDDIYLNIWLKLENRFESIDEFNTALVAFISQRRKDISTCSEFENMFEKMFKQLSNSDRFLGLLQYSQFVTIYESLCAQVQHCPTSQHYQIHLSDQMSEQLQASLYIIQNIDQFFTSYLK